MSNTIEDNIRCLLDVYDSIISPEIKQAPLSILWQLWKSRNDLIFNKENRDPNSVISHGIDNVYEWLEATATNSTHTYSRTPSVIQQHWLPPTTGLVKCNIDASYIYNSDIGV